MITKYIVELLKENSRVIVPDLGAFMASLKSGAPKDSNEVKDKNISFNDFLKYNDGLLVNQIIKEEKVSKDEATAKIKEFVNETDKKIRKGEKVAIEGIGSLFLDDRGSIKFIESADAETVKPDEKKVEDKVTEEKIVEKQKTEKQKVGEKKVEEKKQETPKKEEKQELKKAATEGVGKEVLKSLEKKDDVPDKEEPKKEEPKKEEPKKEVAKTPVAKEPVKKEEVKPYQVPKDNSNQIILWTSIAVVAVIAIVLVILNFNNIKSWIIPEKPVIVEKVEKPPVQTVVTKVDTVKKEPVKKTPPPSPKEFHLIAGSFKIESNAINFVEKLKKDGYNSELIGVRNGYHFVSFSSHETKAQAVQALNQIKKTNEQVWILHMKKQ